MATIADIRSQYPQYQDMSDQELADALYKKHYSDMPRDKFDAAVGMKRQPEYVRVEEPPQQGGRDGDGVFEKIDAGVRGAADMLTLGFADEIAAGLSTGFGTLGDYDEALAEQRAVDRFDEQENPYARLAGQVGGGLTGGVGLAKSGATLVGRQVPRLSAVAPKATATGLAAAEGAAYGGAYGFGSGEGAEDRVRDAKIGAGTGAVMGAAFQKVANSLATRKAARQAAKQADSSQILKEATDTLYEQSRAAGVAIKQPALNVLKNNMVLAAGRINRDLRPKTAGIVDDIEDMFSRNLSLEEFDEVRQTVSQAMARAEPQDKRTLMKMKDMIDRFENSIQAGHITGDIRGFEFIKEARKLNARKAKTELVERVMDDAGVKSGQYTQSGMANAVRAEAKKLYKRIRDGKQQGFTDEEIALIRQMASGKTSGPILRALAKFSPRGVVSFGVGQGVGTLFPGGNILIPGAGYAAGRNVDKSAGAAMQNLRNAAASGNAPVLPQISRGAAPFLLPGAELSTQTTTRRIGGR